MTFFHDTAANVKALCAAIPGLDPATAVAWLRCEGQAIDNPTNPLNIRFGPYRTQIGNVGGFGLYTSPEAGLADAGWLIGQVTVYAGVRDALAAHGTGSKAPDARLVSAAIEDSPWAAGNYGGTGAATGCIVAGTEGKGVPTTPVPPKPAPDSATYTVVAGDTLWGIAAAKLGNGQRWPELYDANRKAIGADPGVIHPGQVLTLPGVAAPAPGPVPPPKGAKSYTVVTGDTLWGIAAEKLGNGARWIEIYDRNRAAIGPNPGIIHAGQRLVLP